MAWLILILCLIATRSLPYASKWLPFVVICPVALTFILSIRAKKEFFHPAVFFPAFYLLWMGGGYAVCFYRRLFWDYPQCNQVAFLILLAYLSWMVGFNLPILRLFPASPRRQAPPDSAALGEGYQRALPAALAIVILGLTFNAIFYLAGAFQTLMSGSIEETRFTMIYGQGYLYHLARSLNIALPVYIGMKWYFDRRLTAVDFAFLLVSLLFVALPLSRRHLLWFVITLIMLFHYLKKRISYKKAFVLTVGMLLFSVLVLQIRYPGRRFSRRFQEELGVHVTNIALYLHRLQEFKGLGLQPFLMNLRLLLPGHQPDFGLWLKAKLGMEFYGGGITAPLIGEGMMSAGRVGVVLEGLITGYLLKWAYGNLQRSFSLRNLFIYIVLFSKMIDVINYGLAMGMVSTIYEIVLVLIMVPAGLERGEGARTSCSAE